MAFEPRRLAGVVEITLNPIADQRGFFSRVFDNQLFRSRGLDFPWTQENHSRSLRKGTIRGLHFQLPPHSETKLVRVVRGRIFDVFVDLRKDSATFGQWDSIELTEDNFKMVLIPAGFAHGFCTLDDHCDVLYKVDMPYAPDHEEGLVFNDESLGVAWPIRDPIISERDAQLGTFRSFVQRHGALAVGSSDTR